RGSRTTAATLANPILNYQVENAPFPGGASPPMDRETMATVMLPLEAVYQRGPRLRRANADVSAASNDSRAARQRIATDATRAYYRAALAQVGAAVAQDLVGWLDTLVVYNRVRVTEGVAAGADLLRSELERDRATAEATMAEADLARARADLASFLGDEALPTALLVAIADRPLRIPRELEDTATAGLTRLTYPQALTGAALVRRPDIVALRDRLDAAGAAVSAERTMVVRQVGAMFGAKRVAGFTSMIAGLSLPFPLFDQNRGEIARATAERDAARYTLAAEERSARAQIAGAYTAARLLTERAEALIGGAAPAGSEEAPVYLGRADEMRRIALGAYREGGVPLLQVLDAARVWGESRITFYTTLFAQHEAVIALVVAEGSDLLVTMPALMGTGANRRTP
ncbi:MAG: TolC family protein, partial [Gemmatimonadaceae bacterium]